MQHESQLGAYILSISLYLKLYRLLECDCVYACWGRELYCENFSNENATALDCFPALHDFNHIDCIRSEFDPSTVTEATQNPQGIQNVNWTNFQMCIVIYCRIAGRSIEFCWKCVDADANQSREICCKSQMLSWCLRHE